MWIVAAIPLKNLSVYRPFFTTTFWRFNLSAHRIEPFSLACGLEGLGGGGFVTLLLDRSGDCIRFLALLFFFFFFFFFLLPPTGVDAGGRLHWPEALPLACGLWGKGGLGILPGWVGATLGR